MKIQNEWSHENLTNLWKQRRYEEVEEILERRIEENFYFYTEKELLALWKWDTYMLTKVYSDYDTRKKTLTVSNDYNVKSLLLEIKWIENKILNK